MMTFTINYLAVLVSAIASMIIGFLYYSPLVVGKQWLKLMNIKMTPKGVKAAQKGMAGLMALSFVCTLIMAVSLAYLRFVIGTLGVIEGFALGAFVWLGFVAPVQYTSVIFAKKPFSLFLIDTGYQLTSLLAMGAILALWV